MFDEGERGGVEEGVCHIRWFKHMTGPPGVYTWGRGDILGEYVRGVTEMYTTGDG